MFIYQFLLETGKYLDSICRKLSEISKSNLMDCHSKTMSLIFLNWWTVGDNLLLSFAYTPRLRTVTQINWVTSKPHIKRKQTILTSGVFTCRMGWVDWWHIPVQTQSSMALLPPAVWQRIQYAVYTVNINLCLLVSVCVWVSCEVGKQ